MTDSAGHEVPNGIRNSTRFTLVRKGIAIVFRPVAIRSNRLHRRTALRATSTGSFHLGFGHARARLCLQTGADVNNFLILVLSGTATGTKETQ